MESIMKIRSIFGAAAAAIAVATATPAAAQATGETVRPHFQQTIPNIPGKSMVALIVDYAPGGASPSHIHARSAFIFGYVLSGEIESQVSDGPMRVYRAGESFYEPPGSVHPISRNASKSKPARLLAVFVVDSDETELTTTLGQESPSLKKYECVRARAARGFRDEDIRCWCHRRRGPSTCARFVRAWSSGDRHDTRWSGRRSSPRTRRLDLHR
jgi:quercetin dioxygenase-like cupin family protein